MGGVLARVMVIFGGRSGEHEVSLASARAVMQALEGSGRHEVVPVGISRSGAWISSGDPMRELERRSAVLAPAHGGEPAANSSTTDLTINPASARERLPAMGFGSVDVVFPVLHGPDGEDGTVQGMLELAGVPYVGSGVLASAVGMDKITMKKIFAQHGLPQVPWLGLTRKELRDDPDSVVRRVENGLSYPVFVKPANLGSSVGINKATDAAGLRPALDEAAALDRRVIVEGGVDAREVEVAVLGNDEPEVSVPGEIILTSSEIYDYEAKYVEGGMELAVPADLPEETAAELERVAREAYRAVDAAGMARIDFFVERAGGRLLLNEINTIPGFTPTSVYSKLWAASGLPYDRLLDRLVELALERHAEKR
jgi:D-alanine-D-alanine ligase